MGKLFGTDGIRGIVGENLTVVVYHVFLLFDFLIQFPCRIRFTQILTDCFDRYMICFLQCSFCDI